MRKLSVIHIFLLSTISSFGQWELIDTSTVDFYRDLEILSSNRVLFMGSINGQAASLIYNPIVEEFDTTFIATGNQVYLSHALNDSTVIAISFVAPSTMDVYKTSDRGQSFSKIGDFPLVYGQCHDFHFVNDTLGFFIGASGGAGVHKTVDGGQTWNQIYDSSLTYPEIGGCAMDNYFSSLFNITGGLFLQSNNYGINWTESYTNIPDRWFESMDFNESNGDIIIGGMGGQGSPNFNYGVIAKTSDFGNTWTYTDIIEAYQIRDVEMVSSSIGYAVGPYTTGGSHSLYKTYDGGDTWHPQEIINAPGYNAVSEVVKCLSVDTCFACGDWGELLQTFNGGIGIHEYDFAPLLAVYPNPVADVINLAGIPFDLKASYSIYSIDGRIIQTGRLEQSISVTDLIAGTYLIRVYADQGERTLKFVKE
ncbi:MAG: T9SS type A sorting domain-containing protein [Flavobacteriales bacterium]|nr:T9SS type A sorting domain-containing protein [Flavobacteriales bacterium]